MVKNVSEMTYAPVTPDNAKNIVIIGAGGIVSGTHLPAYKIADYPVKAIYDIDFEKAKKVAQENDIPNVFETLEEIIDFGVKNDAVFDIAVPASVLGDIFLFSSDGFCKGRVARKIDSVGIFPVKRLYMVAPSE